MSEHGVNQTSGAGGGDHDALISKIIDGEASSADWRTFRRLAEADASLWAEFAETHAVHESLERAVDDAIGVADGVDLRIPDTPEEVFDARVRTLRTWGGWLAAAAVALAWFIGFGNQGVPEMQGASIGGSSVLALDEASAEDAIQRYKDAGMQAGRVVGEMPQRVVLETRPTADGKAVEVLYIRQFIERAVVDRVYRESTDEFGNPVQVIEPVMPVEIEPL